MATDRIYLPHTVIKHRHILHTKTKNSARRSSDTTLSPLSPIYTVISYFFTIHWNVHLFVRVSNPLPFQLLNYNFVCNSHLSNSRTEKFDQVVTLLYSGAIWLKRPRYLWASSVRRRIWPKCSSLFSARPGERRNSAARCVAWSLPPAVFQTYRMQPHSSSRNSVVKYGTVHPSQMSEGTNMDIKCHPNCRHVFVNMNCFLKCI
jgi:hypothetical protein